MAYTLVREIFPDIEYVDYSDMSCFFVIVPRTAWHPLTRRVLDLRGLGVLVKLGIAGVGQTASEWWSWELIACMSIPSTF
jgi:MATE family multidrug resistance protein